MGKNLSNFFNHKKVILGMIHLVGENSGERVKRALQEIDIYEEESLDWAIIEDYHGFPEDLENTLHTLSRDLFEIKIGVNVLSDPYHAFELANKYRASFIQFDTIQASAGDENNPKRFNEELYSSLRKKYPHIFVFGGVRFKYIPSTERTLEEDIRDGMFKCDAIVTTGKGTGIETPIQKLMDFREIMGNFPLIVGAGVNEKNIVEQMRIVDGAIIGSYFKGENTKAKVDRHFVKKIVDLVRE